MEDNSVLSYLKTVLENMPKGWSDLTTHRLDIYNESLAKTEFIAQFEALFQKGDASETSLAALPTAYDYIRLGHPLSCLLEWAIGKMNGLPTSHVISFQSSTAPIMAVLRNNLLAKKRTQICYTASLPTAFDADRLRRVYGYQFELEEITNSDTIPEHDGDTILVTESNEVSSIELNPQIDFLVSNLPDYGSIILVNGQAKSDAVSEIQHVRRRETIAMTPANALSALKILTGAKSESNKYATEENKTKVSACIREITEAPTEPLVGSSGLSIQYAIMMGLIDDALDSHPGKSIKFVVPPNCYGGTNDQARRVAACNDKVEIVDLPVDGDNDMVRSIDRILEELAEQDAIPCIIAEIPTNPRVEVPDLKQLQAALSKERHTPSGGLAVPPVFILDQTFCPNVHFLGPDKVLSSVKAIAYVSGSKFPSGGRCTAGYCVGNSHTEGLMEKVAIHLKLCHNQATDHQMAILAEQLPSMNQRIADAYVNTRAFVNFIKQALPNAKINFVSEALAAEGFTPSVFSLDLPTKGNTEAEREAYKRRLNLKLINMMITAIPEESKYCVSYGQLKGCYWTIPATSTQGTTKEGDKDYIARVSLSANMDLERHKQVFADFVSQI